jgi:hypothetical protein
MTFYTDLLTLLETRIESAYNGTLAELGDQVPFDLSLAEMLKLRDYLTVSSGGGGGSITNYATETGGNLASINTKLPASLGVKTAANSFSVAPASDANFAITTETGLLTYRNTALTNTAVAVKATGGSVRGWNFVNVNTSAVYVKLYNIAAGSVTVGTSPVTRTIAIPAGSASNPAIFFLEAQPTSQEDFSTAISMACVTGLADNSNTAPSTAIHASVRYK